MSLPELRHVSSTREQHRDHNSRAISHCRIQRLTDFQGLPRSQRVLTDTHQHRGDRRYGSLQSLLPGIARLEAPFVEPGSEPMFQQPPCERFHQWLVPGVVTQEHIVRIEESTPTGSGICGGQPATISHVYPVNGPRLRARLP